MDIQQAASALRNGELVVFPTETVYGLGAIISNPAAVQRIFEVKGRPPHNPLIVHIADREQMEDLVTLVPETAKKLMDEFWPGPLTMCLKKSKQVSNLVTGGLDTVCIRQPNHEMARELIRIAGEPMAAPSANLSGKPSSTTFEDAKRQLEQTGVHFLDGGQTPLGLESTVVDCSGEQVRLLRPGSISKEQIEACLGERIEDHSLNTEEISSPGQLLQHYAPGGELTVLIGEREKRRAYLVEQRCDTVGYVGVEPQVSGHFQLFQLAQQDKDLESYAQQLYRFLNWCDEQGAERILLELPHLKDHPLFAAILNRLEKASKGRLVFL